jgi:THO complex subunit 1
MEASYIESLEEPWKSLALKAAPSSADHDSLPSAALRLDQLEVEVRSQFVQLFFETESDQMVEIVGDFWRKALDLCIHLVHEASRPEVSPSYKNMTPRRLPILLLEDSLDALPVEDAKKLWSNYVEPALDGPDLLLGDVMWKSSNVCSLPFLRVCNQFLRILVTASQNDQCEWQGRILTALAKGLSVADRSALKLWGTFHSSNVNDYEAEDVFHENHPAIKTSSSVKSNNKMDYNLYESFWSLQADFANPNHIQVGSFMKKLKAVLEALESAASIRTNWSATPRCNSVRYLTASSLLPTQLASPEFRSAVVSQFLIVASHLSSESAALAKALAPFLTRAKKLLQSDNPECYRLLWDSILTHRENAWRRWKKDKCPVAAFAPKQKPATASSVPKANENPTISGALGDHEVSAGHEYESFHSDELLKVSQELQKTLPTLEEHLEPYVEALDPESGIEADYHPGNDPLFAWRAMRLYAKHQLPLLKHCRRPADLERITREWYRSKGREIPGEMIPPPQNEEAEEDSYNSNADEEEEDADIGNIQDDEEGSKTQEYEESPAGDEPHDEESPAGDEPQDEVYDNKEPLLEEEEGASPDDVEDEHDESSTQSDTSIKGEIAVESVSIDDKATMDDKLATDAAEAESNSEENLGDVADEVEGLETADAPLSSIGSEAGGESFAKANAEDSTPRVKEEPKEDEKKSDRQGRGRRDRERDRKRRRSPSEERGRGGKATRGDRRGGGRGGRRDDGLTRGRGRRDDGGHGSRREDGSPPRGRGPPPPRQNPGPPTASPPYNRGGGRYDDRVSSRGGGPDGRRDDGPLPRVGTGRGGGGHRRDDQRRGRDSFSGNRR